MIDTPQPSIVLVVARSPTDNDATRLLAHLSTYPSFARIVEIVADEHVGLGREAAGREVRMVTAHAAALSAELVRGLTASVAVVLAADVVPSGDVVAALADALDEQVCLAVGRIQATTNNPLARFVARSESSDAPASAGSQTWSAVAIRTATLASLVERGAVNEDLSLTEALWGLDAVHLSHRRVANAVVQRVGPTNAKSFYATSFEAGKRHARIAEKQAGWAPMHGKNQIDFYKYASLTGAGRAAKSKIAAIRNGLRTGFTPLAVDGGVALFHESAVRAGQLSASIKPRQRSGLLMVPDYRYSNPYQALLYRQLPAAGVGVAGCKRLSRSLLLQHSLRTRFLHVHWLAGLADVESEESVEAGIELLRFAKRLGYVLLWTVHNEAEHDTQRPELDERLRAALASSADRIIVHERGSIARLAAKYAIPNERFSFIPHGTYAGAYKPSRDDGRGLRRRLSIPENAFCVGLVGQIRGYKGFLAFVDAWTECADPAWHLLIAGKANDEMLAEHLESLGLEQNNIHLRLGRIPNGELATYLAASDALVFPFRRILNSGSALLATSFARPIVAPAAGALNEMYAAYPSLATLYDPALPLAELIPSLRDLTERHMADRPKEHHAFLEEYSWDHIGAAFIRECLRVD